MPPSQAMATTLELTSIQVYCSSAQWLLIAVSEPPAQLSKNLPKHKLAFC